MAVITSTQLCPGPGAAEPRGRKKLPANMFAVESVVKKTRPMSSPDHSAPPAGASMTSHRLTKAVTALLRIAHRVGPLTAPGGSSAILPDSSRTRMRSSGWRPLSVAASGVLSGFVTVAAFELTRFQDAPQSSDVAALAAP